MGDFKVGDFLYSIEHLQYHQPVIDRNLRCGLIDAKIVGGYCQLTFSRFALMSKIWRVSQLRKYFESLDQETEVQFFIQDQKTNETKVPIYLKEDGLTLGHH